MAQTTREQVEDLQREVRDTYGWYEDGMITHSEMEAKIWFLECQIEALQPFLKEAASVEIDLDLMRPEA